MINASPGGELDDTMKYSKIILTGPESTGKSTIAHAIIKATQLPVVWEYAREYLDIMSTRYEREDLDNIAKVQQFRETIKSQLHPVILCDTDILTLYIWSRYKYGKASFQLRSMYESNDWDKKKYLLFAPDIPWSADAQRENPQEREELYGIYEKALSEAGADYVVIKGKDQARATAAVSAVQQALEG